MADDWVITPRPNTQARLRLFCFHSAGSGASMFVPWVAHLPGDIELNAVQLPGRENRHKEPPYKRMEPLINALDDAVFPLLDRPFAIFGLSLGALVGFEFARKLRQSYGIEPVHFFAASRRAPQTPDRLPLISHLPDAELLDAIQDRYQSIPEVIWKDSELKQLFLPLLRADFTLLETYSYSDDAPMNCPLSVLYGEEDKTINTDDINGWRAHTHAQYTQHAFSGGHFFLANKSADTIHFLVRQGLADKGH